MIDHICITVSNVEISKAFYEKALLPLGYKVLVELGAEFGKATGFGDNAPKFWIGEGSVSENKAHIAFKAKSREAVRDFHSSALSAGGQDNGAPGLRPHYHPDYYGAFVLDPDGYNIEAVSHFPE